MYNGADPQDEHRMKMRGKILRRSASFNVAHAVDDLEPGTGAQSIQRALSLLNLVGLIAGERGSGASLSEIASISGRPKASVHRMLQALIAMGYVERFEEGGYRLGVQSQILGQLAQKSVDPLVTESESSLLRLAELSQDTAFLTMRTGSYSICARREEGFGEILNNALSVGDRHPLGIGAGSLAILSELSPAEVDAQFDANAQLFTERYPKVSVTALRDIIDRARVDGFVHNPGLFAQGSWAVGVPLKIRGSRPRAALSIASIAERVTGPRVERLVALLRHEAKAIGEALSTQAEP
ncbi:MAG: IclR family transcriptional regulator [Brevibacterium sp.]|uniref:IclR family transcriptional regulator n=1 Tax=Brevibacterium sp. TaxID=1701 RepID=UPI0026491317|nr:IclR family transcriptional regulator [Brevibacterium sp.]MDN5807458.1 IclR family transcriptional regulator [Brevibacterium sp.]MDN5875682.1 IclR family transcriptional regulator [Brevibacterium sp.]MDN5910433.1 IclR family transcriptional regulator [Brevibacterium sp.]MDN6134696.1 IclR family transcriptional regulator [Brevibacterium sp.]MDN6174058.1 IclR family transcriptional regulator [Brevibacterium sp.]